MLRIFFKFIPFYKSLKLLKYLLFPFSFLYNAITSIRNFLFDKGILSSTSFDLPVISVGNLTMGGTGKSPHTMYLIELLKPHHKIAVLSRGYGRKTKGYLLANENSDAKQMGDEPYQYYKRYGKEISVAVCENRVLGIKNLIAQVNPEVVLLDDAFQHRKVNPSFSILLTEYDKLFTKDFVFPMGNLRESKKGYKRSHLIVVTKCPENLSEFEKNRIKTELKIEAHQPLFFSSIKYANQLISNNGTIDITEIKNKKILLITGIANPKPLVEELKKYSHEIEHLKYPDHHNFSKKDIKNIVEVYHSLGENKVMITTEKDFMRLEKEAVLKEFLYYLPIQISIDNKENFDTILLKQIPSGHNER